MKNQLQSINKLTNEFSKLPGVGGKTAARFTYHVINMPFEDAKRFAESILEIKNKIELCPTCGNFVEKNEKCVFCTTRKQNLVCVVAEPKDVFSIEKVRSFDGTYHVLHGTINPILGKGPNDIRIKELVSRVAKGGVDEVILATNPDIEGEATALYIAKILKPFGVKTSRIAQGVALGSDIEFADEVTLSKAIDDRKEI